MTWLLAKTKILLNWALAKDDAAKGAIVTISIVTGICIPIAIVNLIVALSHNQTSHEGAIAIGGTGFAILVLAALLTIVLSIFIGGIAKALLKSMTSNWVIITNLLGCIAIGITVAVTGRQSVEILSKSDFASNSALIGFLVLWSAMALNILKTPWDDLRDRVSNADSFGTQ